MMIRLRDLAREVGVHPSTVSRVLSGDPAARLSEATRARILEAAAASGYRPNRLARSLKLRRTMILGMLIPDVTNPVFSSLFRAVEDAAEAAGYSVILCNTDDSPARCEQHLRSLGEGHVEGLLIATARRQDPPLEQLRRRGVPYVLVNRRRDDPSDSWVIPDDAWGAELAVDHLAALGHRRIGHLAGPPTISTSVERREGFCQALSARGLPLDERLLVEGDLSEAGGARAMARLLELPPAERPTGVFVVNDFAALGAIAAARAAGVQVPRDLSVVGHNDSPLASLATPALTTVRVPVAEMGRLAVQMLIQLVGGRAAEPARVTLPVQLVVRDSTAAPGG